MDVAHTPMANASADRISSASPRIIAALVSASEERQSKYLPAERSIRRHAANSSRSGENHIPIASSRRCGRVGMLKAVPGEAASRPTATAHTAEKRSQIRNPDDSARCRPSRVAPYRRIALFCPNTATLAIIASERGHQCNETVALRRQKRAASVTTVAEFRPRDSASATPYAVVSLIVSKSGHSYR